MTLTSSIQLEDQVTAGVTGDSIVVYTIYLH